MRINIFLIVLLIFHLKICAGNNHETIEEYLNKKIEVIRKITGSSGSYRDQAASESNFEENIKHLDPLKCAGSLKILLKNRLPNAMSADRTVKSLKADRNSLTLHIKNKRKLRIGHSMLSNSHVSKVILPFNVSSTTKQLNEGIVANNVVISELKSSMSSRADDSFEDSLRDLTNVKVQNLVLTGKGHPFEDALTSSKSVLIFSEEKILQSMSTSQLTINENRINKISLDKLLNSSLTKQVTGEKSFQHLTVNELTIDERIQNVPKSFLKQNEESKLNASRRIDFEGDINVKHLKVKAINRLNITTFMDEVLLKGGDNELVLNGDLIAESLLDVENLRVNFISKIPATNFMTVSSDQTISSSVFINTFLASNLISPSINGEEISPATVATTTSPNIITAPTRFMDISVIRNLNVEGVQGDATKRFVDLIKRHVIGTKTSDLFQLYNGHVIIQGSLRLRDVQFQSPRSNVFVGGMKVFQTIVENYWMKSINQNVLAPNFVINNEMSAAAQVNVASLNDQLMEKFLLINNERPQGTVWLRFDDVVVAGDVKGHKSNEPSRIFMLSATVVPRNSPIPIEILGNIEFRNELVVKRLRAGVINGKEVNSFIHKNLQAVVFELPVSASSIITSSLFIDRDLFVNTYNNVEMSKFVENALKISQGVVKIDSVIMEKFYAANLQVNQFEGKPFDAMVAKLQEEFDNGAIRERILSVHGDVSFNKNIFVERLNSETIANEFLSSLAKKSDQNVLHIGGKKSFEANLEAKHVLVENLNSQPAHRLFDLSLSRGIKQTIRVPITVRSLQVKSLHANAINDHFYNAFVSKRNLDQPLITSLNLEELIVKDLTTDFTEHDFEKMIKSALYPKRQNWHYINVTKETSAEKLSPYSQLYQILAFGVDKYSPQDIIGNVKIMTPNLYTKTAMSRSMDVRTRITTHNLNKIIFDSVKNYAPHSEIIKAPKVILSGNRFDCNNLYIEPTCSFYSELINGIDIKHLNGSLYRGGNLTGAKHFNHLHVDELKIRGRINGIFPRDIITPNSNLLSAAFQKLEVKELHTFSLNGFSFRFFLENYLKKFGKEQVIMSPLTTTSASFENDVMIPFLNDVEVDACVFNKSNELQVISSHVAVNGKVRFIGPVFITSINGEEIHDHMFDSISRHQTFSCNKLTLKDVDLKKGLKIDRLINKREIKELLESDAHSPKLVDLQNLISNVRKRDTQINEQRQIKESKLRMMYLDTDENINTQYKMLRSNDESDDTICSGNEVDFEPHARGLVVNRKRNIVFEMPSIKAEVMLSCNQSKFEVSWKYDKGQDQFKQIFTNYSEGITSNDIYVFELKTGDNYLVIKDSNKIITYKLDRIVHEWVKMPQSALDPLSNVRIISVVQTPQLETYLIVIKHISDDIFIYKFKDEFTKLHKLIPNTNFDIILNLNIGQSSTFLIFATSNSRKVFIYRLNKDSREFVFQQLLDETLDDIINVIVLHINDEPFIVVSKKSGIFCFYQWRGIENWQKKHCGKFKNLQLMKSFQYLNKQRIFLASNVDNSINALVIHKQGGSS